MKKKIAFLSTLGVGGAENMVVQLVSRIDKSKYLPVVITIESPSDSPFEKILIEQDIKIIYLNRAGRPNIKSMISMWCALDKIKPEIVHSNLHMCVHAVPWIVFHHAKLIHTIHTKPCFEFSRRIRLVMNLMYKIKKAVPIAISNIIAKEACDLYSLNENYIEIIVNPVDTKKFINTGINVKSNKINFITVGRLTPVKNQELLIKAMAELYKRIPNIHLSIVGCGELLKSLQEISEQLNVSNVISFTGNVTNIQERLNTADIFVLTSHYEGLPLSILEAMSTSLPIISTDVGGVSDIVKENGILIKEGNLNELVSAMEKLANDTQLRHCMGMISRKEAEKYDIDKIVLKYQGLYEKYS